MMSEQQPVNPQLLPTRDLSAAYQSVVGRLDWHEVEPDRCWRTDGPEAGWSAAIERLKGGSAAGRFLARIIDSQAGAEGATEHISDHSFCALDGAQGWVVDRFLFLCYLRHDCLPAPFVAPTANSTAKSEEQ